MLTVRLLFEYARKSRKKLFLLFIDFEKAYHKAPRHSRKFIPVLAKIYSDIKLVFRSAVIICSIGVRQGAATSILLFIIYQDIMVKMINRVEKEGFLGSKHVLWVITLLLATSRERLVQKFNIVQEFCSIYGKSINISKTKFMVINKEVNDKVTLLSNSLSVKYCQVDVSVYMNVIKLILNVRRSTCNKLCLIESGMSPPGSINSG